MFPPSFDTPAGDNEAQHAWYDDSLSLIPHGDNFPSQGSTHSNEPTTAADMTRPGILLKPLNGDMPFEFGNCVACHEYLAGRSVAESAAGTDVAPIDDGIIIASRDKDGEQIIHWNRNALACVLQNLVPQIELPNSEFNLLIQVLSGMSLKQAADADRVSYETKRSQFKSLAARIGFNTQNEVIRNVLLAMNSRIAKTLSGRFSQAQATKHETGRFLEMYYPGIFRFHEIALGEGRNLRVAETGPLDGEAVIWLHSQTLPCPGQFTDAWTHKNGIRLIIPLRRGFLENAASRFSIPSHIKYCTDDMVAAVKYFCNGSARLVANSTGVPYAINMAINHPLFVKHITFCASSYIGRYKNQPVQRLVNGVKNLVTKNEMLIASMFERYLAKMSSLPGIKSVLEASYENSPWDMAVFNNLLSSPVNHSWMYESYRNSRHSVILDVAMGGYDVWKDAHKISCPTLFIHGALDPINFASDAMLASKLVTNSRFELLDGEGQSLFLTRLADLVGTVH